jgi:hypothetical protein
MKIKNLLALAVLGLLLPVLSFSVTYVLAGPETPQVAGMPDKVDLNSAVPVKAFWNKVTARFLNGTIEASPAILDQTSSDSQPASGVQDMMAQQASDQTPSVTSIGNPDTGGTFDPPVVGQGGDCIDGFVIDVYGANWGGAGWNVTITPSNPPINLPIVGGPPMFMTGPGLTAGEYIISLTMPSGWKPSTAAQVKVTLNGVPNSGCAHIRFKVEALACLEVYKYDIIYTNAVPGRVGIPGWTIQAAPAATAVPVLQQITNGSGKATFLNLDAGSWNLTEVVLPGWQPAIPPIAGPIPVVLISPPGGPNTNCLQQKFYNEQITAGTITVVKQDTQGNPIVAPNWYVAITYDAGTQGTQTGPTAGGIIVFPGLAFGDWTITEAPQPPWWRPVVATGKVTLSKDTPEAVVTLVNEHLGCVEGYKINDLDEGLPNWVIRATDTNGNPGGAVFTNAAGYFRLYLSLGTWTISEDPQPGWKPVTPDKFTVEVTEYEKCKQVRFKNHTDYACLDVWKKDYYHRLPTTGEPVGLSDWPITIQPAFGGAFITQVTDGTGWVRFNQLTPGAYNITDGMLDGWVPVGFQQVIPAPAGIINAVPVFGVTLEASGTCAVVNVYNRQKNTPDPGDPPLPESSPDVPPPPLTSSRSSGDATCSISYIVQSGDTLFHIGLRYGVDWQDISRANQIADPRQIQAGMTLCIP